MIISKLGVIPQSIISNSLNNPFKYSALDFVLLLNKILETFIFFKAKIIDGTTPPAPKIKTFLFLISYFVLLNPSSKPAISVL